MAALKVRARWLEVAAWIFTLIAYPYYDSLRLPHILGRHSLAAGVRLFALFRGTGSVQGQNLIIAASTALFLVGLAVDMSQCAGLGYQSTMVGPYRLEFHPILTAIFTTVMVLDLTRRLLADSAEKQALASELEAARVVQGLLIPNSASHSDQYRMESAYEPAQQVGGDFHWSRVTPDGSLVVIVGDVSGKGLKAAMLVSVAVGALHRETSSAPGAVLAGLDSTLENRLGGGHHCLLPALRARRRDHPGQCRPPEPYWNGRELEVPPGLPLGVVPDVDYEEATHQMQPGDRITLVSDGVV